MQTHKHTRTSLSTIARKHETIKTVTIGRYIPCNHLHSVNITTSCTVRIRKLNFSYLFHFSFVVVEIVPASFIRCFVFICDKKNVIDFFFFRFILLWNFMIKGGHVVKIQLLFNWVPLKFVTVRTATTWKPIGLIIIFERTVCFVNLRFIHCSFRIQAAKHDSIRFQCSNQMLKCR